LHVDDAGHVQKMADTHKCPVSGCPFAKAMEANLLRASVDEPELEKAAV
jgi:hypothetical protein